MSDKPPSRIRPLARRLDSLAGSPTSAGPAIRPRASPKPVSSISSSSGSSVAGDVVKSVKDEDISIRDMLSQAKLRESKMENAPAPALRTRKQVIRNDIEGSRKLGAGEGVLFSRIGPNDDSPEGVAIDASESRCYPVKVPFDVSYTVEDTKEPLMNNNELFLVQLPGLFPTLVPPTVEGSPAHPTGRRRGPKTPQAQTHSATTGTPFSEIPDGRIGTWKIHKSGRIVMHVGTTQFEVTEGQKVNFRSEVACVCPSESEIMFLGEATKRLVVSPIIS